MKFVKLTYECVVNPLEITEVTADYEAGVITVNLRSGIGYKVFDENRIGISKLLDKLKKQIDEALCTTE